MCYVGATFAMKYYDRITLATASVSIVAFLIGAVFFEILALRAERFGLILLLILGIESALGLMISWGWFHETYSPKEIVGFALIIIGIGLLKT